MSTSSFEYRNIIDSFKSRLLTEKDIEKRLSDLMLVFDFSSSLTRTGDLADIANLLLLTLMGYTTSRRGLFLRVAKDGLDLVAHKGFRSRPAQRRIPMDVHGPFRDYHVVQNTPDAAWKRLGETLQVDLLVPLHREDKLLGVVGIGGVPASREYTAYELEMTAALVQMCVLSIQNAETHMMLESLNRQLILKVYQLNTLFELSKDFNATWDSESLFRILGASLIGQLLVSRVAVFTFTFGFPEPKFVRGFRFGESENRFLQDAHILSCFPEKQKPLVCGECDQPALAEFYAEHKVNSVFPIVLNDEIRGVIFLGEKRNRKPFSQEDTDFITTLGNLALVSEENVRNQQQIIEKQRMEKELSIAREIQQNLLPHTIPQVPGYEITTAFEPAYQVGGDYFDVISVSGHELSIAIGDVSGKGTPAAMIMASVQASLRALASMEVSDPGITIHRLNQLLCRNQSGSNKYVTFFYGVLNFQTHRLSYVNAGHCYPLILKPDGRVDRLEVGGMVMGFFPDVVYRSGAYVLESDDLMVMYTDGVSELIDANEEEFGVERLVAVLREHHALPVKEIREKLMATLEGYRGDQKQWDDLTLILLKRM